MISGETLRSRALFALGCLAAVAVWAVLLPVRGVARLYRWLN